MEAFKSAASLIPSDEGIWLDWSLVLYDQGNYQEAIEILEQGLEEYADSVDIHYRIVVYLMSMGHYKEAFNKLEIALILDFDKHVQLFEFFKNPQTQSALFKIIEQYRKKDNK